MTNNSSEDILKELETALSGGGNTKALRFFLNCLSGTPIVGGGFSATSGLWSEQEQDKINEMLISFAKLTDERISQLENSLVDSVDPTHCVAGFITFNPNKAEFIDSSRISSLTDNGTLDFIINFTQPFHNYVFNCYGSGKVNIAGITENKDGLHILFEEPCPDKVTVVFYEQ